MADGDSLSPGAGDLVELQQAQVDDDLAALRGEVRGTLLDVERAMAEKFRLLREQHGLSQAELAGKMGELGFEMHQTTVAKMEAGRRPLRVAEMLALGHIFKMPPGAVFLMPVATSSPSPSMNELADILADEEARYQQLLDSLRKTLEARIDLAAQHLSRQQQLVELMRAGGIAVASDGGLKATFARHERERGSQR